MMHLPITNDGINYNKDNDALIFTGICINCNKGNKNSGVNIFTKTGINIIISHSILYIKPVIDMKIFINKRSVTTLNELNIFERYNNIVKNNIYINIIIKMKFDIYCNLYCNLHYKSKLEIKY